MRSWSVIPGGGDEGAVDSQTGLRLSRSPENIRGEFFTWKIFRVVVLGDIRRPKNNRRNIFRIFGLIGYCGVNDGFMDDLPLTPVALVRFVGD